MNAAQILRAFSIAIATTAAFSTATGQIPSSPLTPRPFERPQLLAPKADSIPKPVFVGESPEETAKREAVERALDKNVDLAFKDTPLTEAVAWIREQTGVPVDFDRRALEDAGISVEEVKVTLTLRKVSLRAALRIMLRRLDLSYYIQHGSLFISDPSRASHALDTALFPIADLIDGLDSSGRRIKDYETVIELITACVAPVTWDAVGGSGSLKEFDGTLAISQTPEMLAEVERFLRAIRIARQQQSTGDFTPLATDFENENTTRVLKALETKVNLDCRDTPLTKLVEMVAIESGVNVLLDENALRDAGIEETTKVDGRVKDIPLGDALDRLLGGVNLAYTVRNEVLWITTNEYAPFPIPTHVYPLDDLYRNSFDDEQEAFDERIVELVTSTIHPTTWDAVGGHGNIFYAEPWNVLVVSNSREVQEKIAGLFAKLRELRTRQDRSALLRDDVETRVYLLGDPAVASKQARPDADNTDKTDDKADGKDAAASPIDGQELATAIRELIEPNSWSEDGVYLRVLGDRIVVRHRRTVQAKVRLFLRELRAPEAIPEGQPHIFGGRPIPLIGERPPTPADKEQTRTAQAPSEPAPAKELSPDERVEQALTTQVDINFTRASLDDVAAWIKKQHNIEVEVDRKSLENIGFDFNRRFTLTLKQVSLEAALAHLLRAAEVCVTVEGGRLLIADSDRCQTAMLRRLYDVSDLIAGKDRDQRAARTARIVKDIEEMCAPNTWNSVGGSGNVRAFGNQLIVSQTYHAHAQVRHVLATIRRARAQRLKRDYTPINPYPPNAGDARVLAALRRTVDLDVDNMPLDAFAKLVSEISGVNVIVDRRSMVEAGIEHEITVTGKAQDLRLRDALRKLLHDSDLMYSPMREALLLTTADKTYCPIVSMIFPIGDFVERERSGEPAGKETADFITSTIAPSTWDAVGGSGSIRYDEATAALFTTNTPEVIDQFNDLLPPLRKLSADQAHSRPANAATNKVELRVYATGEAFGKQRNRGTNELANSIRERVEPKTWSEPDAYLSPLGDRLIVRHRPSVQRQVQSYLATALIPEGNEANPGIETE
jgi:hypothetical protein